MKISSIILLCACSIFSFDCYTQRHQKECSQIYFHSCELNNSCDTSIEKINFNDFSHRVVVKYKNHVKKTISIDSVWGYRSNEKLPQRIYEKRAYTLYEFYSPIYIYLTSNSKMYTHYFFSKTLDSEIFLFTKKQLQKELNPALVEKILSDRELKKKLQ